MDKLVRCLDHGFVRLVDHMGSDLSVVRAARVSYNATWRAGEDSGSDARLIDYLWRNQHTSPFESVVFTFEVAAPIFIFRQWHRHRTWSFNEVSARYTELPETFYVPAADVIGKQSASNKQARDVAGVVEDMITPHKIAGACKRAFRLYRDLLADGVPRELARSVLPLATYSRMFATVDLLNLFKFIGLRDHGHAQYEIAIYARAMLGLVSGIVPECVAAFERHRKCDG